MLVTGLVVFLSVVHGSGPVRVRGQFVELSGSLMRIFWHILALLLQARVVAAIPFRGRYATIVHPSRLRPPTGAGELVDVV